MEKVHDYLVEYLRSKGYPEVKKHRHEYLCYYGFDQSHVYVLIEGVVKASVTMREGTEFNVFYMQGPSPVSLLRDEESAKAKSPFSVRVESDEALFYVVPRLTFWKYVNEDHRLLDYVKDYYRRKEVPPDELARALQVPPVTDLGFATVDNQRGARTGTSEIIYGAGKTKEQIAGIVTSMLEACQRRVLVTRLDGEKAAGVSELLAAGGIAMEYDPVARLGMVGDAKEPDGLGTVLVVCAGTSDLPVAEEAARTLEYLGNRVDRAYDVGVAGIHRLLACEKRIRDARVIVAVAGMEGALASVVAGLASCPVIAVPTSVGYGASLGGVAALLAMLNSCANGVSVVNIDNGFGAAYQASLINHMK